MDKIRILDDAPTGLPGYAHLEVIVDFLLSNGNVLSHNFRWGSNKEGYFCHVAKSIDFSQLKLTFDFPSTIIFGEDRNVIYCQNSGSLIQTLV